MPSRGKRTCASPGCGGFAEYRGRCHKCNAKDAEFRGTTAERGYDSTWQKLRRMKLARNPLCEMGIKCENKIPDNAATEVDHIIPIRKRPDLRLVMENLQALCRSCHSFKTNLESGWHDR